MQTALLLVTLAAHAAGQSTTVKDGLVAKEQKRATDALASPARRVSLAALVSSPRYKTDNTPSVYTPPATLSASLTQASSIVHRGLQATPCTADSSITIGPFVRKEYTGTSEQYEEFAQSLTGILTEVQGEFTLDEDGEGGTWADDLTILIARATTPVSGLDDFLVQVGGYADIAPTKESWPGGASGAAGTTVNAIVQISPDVDVSGYQLFMGNGYLAGGLGIWSGTSR